MYVLFKIFNLVEKYMAKIKTTLTILPYNINLFKPVPFQLFIIIMK